MMVKPGVKHTQKGYVFLYDHTGHELANVKFSFNLSHLKLRGVYVNDSFIFTISCSELIISHL